MPDFYTQHPSLNDRVVIVEPSIDSRHLDLMHQVSGTCEGVRHGVRDQAVHRECEVGGSEIAGQNGRDSAGNATVRGRILWMAGSTRQRLPILVSSECRITSSCLNRGDGTPETEGKLRIPAADPRICIARLKHCHQSGRV